MATIRSIVRYLTSRTWIRYPTVFLVITVVFIVLKLVYKQVPTADNRIVDVSNTEIVQEEDSIHPNLSGSAPGNVTLPKNEAKEQQLNPMSDRKFFRNASAIFNMSCQFTLLNFYVYFNKERCCEYGRAKSLEELCGQVNETTLGNKTPLGDLCTCVEFMACKMVIVTGIS